MMLTKETLSKIFIHAFPGTILSYLSFLNNTFMNFEMNSPERQAAFLAQIGHESSELHNTIENLNYSIEGLKTTWPNIFLNDFMALQYARQPEKIANKVYANKNGNGDENSGDGWKYRGRGLIQITGRANYKNCAIQMNRPYLMDQPEYLETTNGACESAGVFWRWNRLNMYADIRDMTTITKKINGGLNGYDDRMRIYNLALKAYGV